MANYRLYTNSPYSQHSQPLWGKPISTLIPREVISIDGKTLRRSYDREDQKKVNEKSNEITAIPEYFEVVRSKPHGHVALILETIKKLNLDTIISSQSSRNRNLIMAMIAARIINPGSKLATARSFNEETCSNSLGQILNLKKADEDELYLPVETL